MHVPVLVLERFMQVLVFVRLCHVQIDTDTHELRRPDERKGRLARRTAGARRPRR